MRMYAFSGSARMFVIGLSVLLVSCGGGSSDNNSSTETPVDTDSSSTETPVDTTTASDAQNTSSGATELEGAWKLCQNLSEISDSTVYTFSGNTFTEVTERYTDNDCTTLQSELVRYTGTFALGTTLTTGSGASARQIDLQYLTGFVANQQPIYYDIVQIDNDVLFKGDVFTGSTLSPDQRPTDVSYSLEYVRQ